MPLRTALAATLATTLIAATAPQDTTFHVLRSVPESYRNMTPRGFAAKNGSLYFLLSDPSGSHAIAVTDHTGSLRKILSVAETRLVNDWLAIADDGGLYVRQLVTDSGGTSERILRLDSVGRATKTWEFKPGLFTSALIGDQIVAISVPNKAQIHGQDGALVRSIEWTTTQKPTQLKATALNAQRVAVVDPINLRTQIVDTANGTSTNVEVRLNGVESHPGDLTIADVASAGDGTLYLLAGKGKFRDGALVVQMDAEGREVARHRCALPTFDELKTTTNPDGQMWPMRVQVDGDYLFVYDSLGGVSKCLLKAN